MLFTLGFSQAETDGEADNEIHIFTRKMISKGELRDARVGVVGVVTWLHSLSSFAAAVATASKNGQESATDIVSSSASLRTCVNIVLCFAVNSFLGCK